MSQRVSTSLSLRTLVVCDWTRMPTVVVMIVFMATLCLKFNNVPQPHLKQPGCVTKKNKFAKIAF